MIDPAPLFRIQDSLLGQSARAALEGLLVTLQRLRPLAPADDPGLREFDRLIRQIGDVLNTPAPTRAAKAASVTDGVAPAGRDGAEAQPDTDDGRPGYEAEPLPASIPPPDLAARLE